MARYLREVDDSRCEFAIVVDDEWQGRGLAKAILTHLIDHARTVGLRTMVGYIHAQNLRMLHFIRRDGLRDRRLAARNPACGWPRWRCSRRTAPMRAAERRRHEDARCVIGTGGTIAGSAPAATQTTGYRAGAVSVTRLVEDLPHLAELAKIRTSQPFSIGSQHMTSANWLRLAALVREAMPTRQWTASSSPTAPTRWKRPPSSSIWSPPAASRWS